MAVLIPILVLGHSFEELLHPVLQLALSSTRSSDALAFMPEIKIASFRDGSDLRHSDAHSRPALDS
jgi:hypothetical protein